MKYLKKVENVDYQFLENKESFNTPIEILTGPYSGVKYCYGAVRLNEATKEEGELRFSFYIFDLNEDAKIKLSQDEKFVRHIGEILNSIILDDA